MNMNERLTYLISRIEYGFYTVKDGLIYNKGGKLLKRTDTDGYLLIDIRFNGKSLKIKQHRLLYAYYHGIDSLIEGLTINHIDGNKLNNKMENLEQVTIAENNKHASEHNLVQRGESHYKATLTDEQVIQIRDRSESSRILAKEYGVSKTTILKIKSGKVRK